MCLGVKVQKNKNGREEVLSSFTGDQADSPHLFKHAVVIILHAEPPVDCVCRLIAVLCVQSQPRRPGRARSALHRLPQRPERALSPVGRVAVDGL